MSGEYTAFSEGNVEWQMLNVELKNDPPVLVPRDIATLAMYTLAKTTRRAVSVHLKTGDRSPIRHSTFNIQHSTFRFSPDA
jgi:hypothetical protein